MADDTLRFQNNRFRRPRGASSVAAMRRTTIQLARDVLLRRFSSVSGTQNRIVLLEDAIKLVTEVSHQVAVFRQMVQTIGTPNDSNISRKEISTARTQCLKSCDNTKEAVMPQLRNESHQGVQSSGFTRQASQFIGCLGAFLNEMRRNASLLRSFPSVPITAERHTGQPSATEDASTSKQVEHQQEIINLNRDIQDVETMLETLENLITVHFATSERGEKPISSPRSRQKGCRLGRLCTSFKTSYV